MVSLTNEEEKIIEVLVECLAHAIARTDDIDPADLNKTIVQKFVYLGIQRFDLPITYSWYLAGSLVESNIVSPTTLNTAFDDLPTPSEPTIDAKSEDDPDREATRSLADEHTDLDDAPADVQREFELERDADPTTQTR